jgi:hypothetical protein
MAWRPYPGRSRPVGQGVAMTTIQALTEVDAPTILIISCLTYAGVLWLLWRRHAR